MAMVIGAPGGEDELRQWWRPSLLRSLLVGLHILASAALAYAVEAAEPRRIVVLGGSTKEFLFVLHADAEIVGSTSTPAARSRATRR